MQDYRIELNPNCSEATVYLDVTKLSERELQVLLEYLERLESSDEWYDTNVDVNTLFGLKVVRISGETPYNYTEWLIDSLKALPFWNKMRWEYEE